ncbi:hypothetical protein, partial [Photobacterium phosphoreum]|uniref:hypothetical protein n=1 Tax=Photobacterium phosphoreum TaxID=659 RepID=UPI0039B00D40
MRGRCLFIIPMILLSDPSIAEESTNIILSPIDRPYSGDLGLLATRNSLNNVVNDVNARLSDINSNNQSMDTAIDVNRNAIAGVQTSSAEIAKQLGTTNVAVGANRDAIVSVQASSNVISNKLENVKQLGEAVAIGSAVNNHNLAT